MRKSVFTLMVLLSGLLVGCQALYGLFVDEQGAALPTAVADPALAARGVEVYRQYYCGVCHTLEAANTTSTFGPRHDDAAAQAAAHLADPAYAGAATTPAEYLRESIIDPQAYFVPGYERSHHPMPAFVNLTDEELDALVALLLAQ